MEQSKTHHDGKEVLEEDEIDTCAMEVCQDADLDVTGASTIAEATQRIAPDKTQKSKEDKDVSAKCDSDSSSDGQKSDADANDHDSDAATESWPGDGSGKDSDDDFSVSDPFSPGCVACSTRTGRGCS